MTCSQGLRKMLTDADATSAVGVHLQEWWQLIRKIGVVLGRACPAMRPAGLGRQGMV